MSIHVGEEDRSWCTSSGANDHRAITIEVANDGGEETGWHISDKAYKALIELLVDVCQRNDIGELKWKNDKSLIGNVAEQNMTVHRWFANKSCPGDYLMSLHPQIASEVNSRLGGSSTLYRVQVGAYKVKKNAENMLKKLKADGYDGFIIEVKDYVG